MLTANRLGEHTLLVVFTNTSPEWPTTLSTRQGLALEAPRTGHLTNAGMAIALLITIARLNGFGHLALLLLSFHPFGE